MSSTELDIPLSSGRLHAQRWGDPAAPLVVCVHGSGCNSGYFDLAGNSLLAAATERGMPVLLLDRPGHGASGAAPPGSAIDRGAEAVGELLDALYAARADLRERQVALVGHSFGGAVALTFAARNPGVTIAAVCVSGIGDVANPDYVESRRGATASPAALWLFGPGSSYDWRGITALRAAADRWRAEEVDEIAGDWPRRWARTVSAVTCPVHFRLAEHERIWDNGPHAIKRITAAFTRSAYVDAGIALDGGHLYEVHLRGPELVGAQLDFIRDAGARRN
jgi:pimeloyl-ACP methyl ester carboxylesterase